MRFKVYPIYVWLQEGVGVRPVFGPPGNKRQMQSSQKGIWQKLEQLLFKAPGQARRRGQIHGSNGTNRGGIKYSIVRWMAGICPLSRLSFVNSR